MILSSTIELAEKLDRLLKERDVLLDEIADTAPSLPLWNIGELHTLNREISSIECQIAFAGDTCFHCGEFIDNTERPFIWRGCGQTLTMHRPCLLDWIPRLEKDLDTARGVGNDE